MVIGCGVPVVDLVNHDWYTVRCSNKDEAPVLEGFVIVVVQYDVCILAILAVVNLCTFVGVLAIHDTITF